MFAACAASAPPSGGPGSSTGPTVDLAGFVVTDQSGGQRDQSLSHDLSTPDLLSPHDLAMPPDMSLACSAVGSDGICQGDTYIYCLNNTVVTEDCTAEGSGCEVIGILGGAGCWF